MKKFLVLLPLALITGCSALAPHKVEFFQRKVRAFPEVSESAKETQRKAADYIATKTQTNEIAPVTRALSGSLGPPSSPWTGSATNLVQRLDKQHAAYNEDLKDYAKHIDKDAGKKIEGTGFFSIGYFAMWGIGLGVVFLLFAALKIYGMVNPVVGAGTAIAQRVGSAIVGRGFHELVQGGEAFKDYVEKSPLTAEVRAQILDLFTRAHKENQSKDVQSLVSKITT